MALTSADIHAFAAQVRRLVPEPEPTLYPAFAALAQAGYSAGVQVDQLRRAPLTGFPDLTVMAGARARTWIEVKHPSTSVDPLPAPDQIRFDRYVAKLPHIVLTNGWTWLLYEGNKPPVRCDLPQTWLMGKTQLPAVALADLIAFFDRLDHMPPVAATTRDDAIAFLASAAQLVREAILDLCVTLPPVLRDARAAFDRLLQVNPVGGMPLSDEQFADTLAQTVVFGYLLAHIENPSSRDIGPYTALEALLGAEIPFIKSALHALVAPDPDLEASLVGALRTAADHVNAAAPILRAGGSWNGVVYAYEDFFARYKPDARRDLGVYYTPKEIVDFQVSETKAVLKRDFSGRSFLDPDVCFLDPACGTGTYLVGIAEAVIAEATAAGAPVGAVLTDLFAHRLVAFEVSPGPACVAQARIAALLRSHNIQLGDRLPIFTVNSLTPPASGGAAPGQAVNLWADYVGLEQREGDRVKSTVPIFIVLGNPPYGRRDKAFFDTGLPGSQTNLLDDWATMEAGPARQSVYDLYTAFWRLAAGFLLERPAIQQAAGIISYITNRTWLDGDAHGAMREWLTNHRVNARVIDLGGDRRRGARAGTDGPVFPIETGTAVSTLSFGGRTANQVEYFRIRGTAPAKLQALANHALPPSTTLIRVQPSDPFAPVEWGPLADAPTALSYFARHHPGVKTARDQFVIAVDESELTTRLASWAGMSNEARQELFHSARRRAAEQRRGSSTGRGRSIPGTITVNSSLVRRITYRPLDRRYLYADRGLIDDPGALFNEAVADPNLAFLAVPNRQFVNGPVLIAGAGLADYQIYGRAGADLMPLSAPASSGLFAAGSALSPDAERWATGFGAGALEVAHYLLCLGNAPTFTVTFLEAIQSSEVRLPATADSQLFGAASAVGQDLLRAWLLQAPPLGTWHQTATTGTPLGSAHLATRAGALDIEFASGDRLAGIHPHSDSLVINERHVLLRFLEDRAHLPLSLGMAEEIRLVAGSVGAIVSTQPDCDRILTSIIAGPTTIW